MSVTLDTSQFEMSPLNAFADRNIQFMSVTLDTSHQNVGIELACIREHAAHVGDAGYVPLPDVSVCTVSTIACWGFFEACDKGAF